MGKRDKRSSSKGPKPEQPTGASAKASLSNKSGGAGVPSWEQGWLFGLLLIIATLMAYGPALKGTPIWDDDGHITKLALRSWYGLVRI